METIEINEKQRISTYRKHIDTLKLKKGALRDLIDELEHKQKTPLERLKLADYKIELFDVDVEIEEKENYITHYEKMIEKQKTEN